MNVSSPGWGGCLFRKKSRLSSHPAAYSILRPRGRTETTPTCFLHTFFSTYSQSLAVSFGGGDAGSRMVVFPVQSSGPKKFPNMSAPMLYRTTPGPPTCFPSHAPPLESVRRPALAPTRFAPLRFPDYQDTVNKTSQWERPTQRPRSSSVSSGRPEVVDMPIAHTRRGSNASSADNSRRSSSSHAHDHPHRRESAAGDPSPPPALGSIPAAPSYRTAVYLSNRSAQAAAAGGGAQADAGGRPLPPNWERRTASNNRPCECFAYPIMRVEREASFKSWCGFCCMPSRVSFSQDNLTREDEILGGSRSFQASYRNEFSICSHPFLHSHFRGAASTLIPALYV